MNADLVLVSHNSKDDLMKFLPSIRAFSAYSSLVIVDNSDDEETREWLRNCGENFHFMENKGFGAACNIGARFGDSAFIVFLNCDLSADRNWLDNLLKPFENPKVGATGARLFHPDGREYPTPDAGNAIGCCYAIRRSFFEQLGGFDENFFLFFEETDLSLRIQKAGFDVVRSEARLIHYHPHFLPLSPVLQPYWDKSEKYFKEKHTHIEKKQSLALVMIVKNEEKGLERAILSCRDFVDEIVIAVDRSTTDKTAMIAEKYAKTVKFFDWQDDFASARNFAHDGIKTDWILFLDGHEFVEKSPELAEHLALDCDGLLCTVEMENGTQFRNPRIYKNGLRFEGKIHEIPTFKNMQLYTGFRVKHDRTGGQELKSAIGRNIQRDDMSFRIMGAQIKENPQNCRALFHLGLYFEGHGQYKKAIKYFNRYLRYSKIKSERWYVYFNKSLCQLALGQCFRAFWSADMANYETPDRWEIAKLKGFIFFQRGKFSKAAEAFVESFKINTGDQTYKPWPRDEVSTWNLIGECFYYLGEFYKASVAFDEAVKKSTDKKFKELTGKRAKLMYEMAKNQGRN